MQLTSSKNSGPQGLANPLWQYSGLGEQNAVYMICLGKDNWKLIPSTFLSLSYTPFSIANFNLYPSAVIDHNYGYNNSAKFCESF